MEQVRYLWPETQPNEPGVYMMNVAIKRNRKIKTPLTWSFYAIWTGDHWQDKATGVDLDLRRYRVTYWRDTLTPSEASHDKADS